MAIQFEHKLDRRKQPVQAKRPKVPLPARIWSPAIFVALLAVLLAVPEVFASNVCGFEPTDEVGDPLVAVTPIYHQPGWQGERQLPGYEYSPSYEPNVVSFDSANVPFMRMPLRRSDGQLDFLGVQRLDTLTGCSWETSSLAPALESLGWLGSTDSRIIDLRFSIDQRVVFDDDDNAYTFVASNRWPRLWAPALAFSPAASRENPVWTATLLDEGDRSYGRVQPRSFHGTMAHPPLVMVKPASYSDNPRELGLIAPTLNANGQIQVPEPILLDANGTQGGGMGARFAVSRGDRTFLVWASLSEANVPPDLTLEGTPTFIQVYDHAEGRLVGQPFFLGFAGNLSGGMIDGHNSPAIDIDSQGYLHVILGGHHDNFQYLRSEYPVDSESFQISEPTPLAQWTTPVLLGSPRFDRAPSRNAVPAGDPDPDCRGRCGQYTYASLIIDDRDNLHVFARWAGHPFGESAYIMRISYLRKPFGEDWEPRRTLVRPFRTNYSHWYQKPAIDRLGRLFLSYIYYGTCLLPEDADSYREKYPEETIVQAEAHCDGAKRRHKYSGITEHEPVVLISDDHGETWRLATTADFADGLFEVR